MKIAVTVALIGAATAAAAGLAGPAFADTPTTPPSKTVHTVDSLKAQVDKKADHITAKMQALQTKLAAKPKLAASKSMLDADIAKTLADTAAWRKQVDAAATKAGIRAADPAHKAVNDDLAKLKSDLAGAKKAMQ